ncbi:calpain-3-like [Haliotis rufescens]|uniref:calpain-3-like n=1 Tax=Haliotis rufescens TaxID=6454 RepID=UPI00201EBFBB|nr:calpain-3-like [Haliotis rufescens]XP_048237271.1 calpain-3-like [Haliotis rufescens]
MGCGSSTSTSPDYPNNDYHDNNGSDERGNRQDHHDNRQDHHDDRQDHHDNRQDHHDNRQDHHGDIDQPDTEDNETRITVDHEPEPEPDIPEARDNEVVRSNRRHSDVVDNDGSGLKYATVDFRTAKSPGYHDSEPSVDSGERWTDEEFPLHVAIQEHRQKNLGWKRASELAEDPVLFTEGTTRFDIGQGSAGTCWFLSMVANLSDHPQQLRKVVQDNDYSRHTGVFHCRFWKFGVWEDVYIDDHLPVVYGKQIWGAKSSSDDNEMWVSMLEKSFAKLHGSYNAVYGGQSSDAYMALTGGISERLDFEEDNIDPDSLFRRVRNSLYTGAFVSCTVPEKHDGVYGLIGAHAYSLTGAQQVQRDSGDNVYLLRVRNPWGNTEWKGPWSDESEEWSTIPAGAVQRVNIDDGEFWISLPDFLTYFSQTTICSLTPDFDSDGCSDSLDNVLRIYGQWLGDTAAGFSDRLQNPRYVFTVPDEGMTEEGYVPLVVQLIQKTQHRKSDLVSVRCDLYKVLGSDVSGRPTYVLEMLGTETNVYSPGVQVAFRHRVEPGHYVVVPSTIDAAVEKEFLIRIFAPCPLHNCSEVPRNTTLMSCESVEVDSSAVKLTTSEAKFGSWRSGVNAGGQISKRETHHLNPQYAFTIPSRGMPVPVFFNLMQPQEEPKFPIGLRVYPLQREAPVDIDYLYDQYDNCPETEGGDGSFMITWDLNLKYVLPPGDYVAVIHMDEPNTEKAYALLVRSSAHLNIRGYQTGQ